MRKWAWNKIRSPRPGCKCVATKNTRNIRNIQAPSQWKSPVWGVFLGPGSLRACCSVRPAIIGTHTVPSPPGGRLSVDHRKIDVRHLDVWSKVLHRPPDNEACRLRRRFMGELVSPQNGSEWIRMVPVIGCLKCEIGCIGNNTGKPSNRRIAKGPSKTYTMVAMVILQGLHPHLSCSRWGQIGPLPSMPSAVRYLYHRLRGSVQNSANMFYQSSITGYHGKDLEHHTGIISKATVESALRNADSSSKPSWSLAKWSQDPHSSKFSACLFNSSDNYCDDNYHEYIYIYEYYHKFL